VKIENKIFVPKIIVLTELNTLTGKIYCKFDHPVSDQSDTLVLKADNIIENDNKVTSPYIAPWNPQSSFD
jgi:hypothetical protein